MEQGKIIKSYTVRGKEIVIRYPKLSDFDDIMEMLEEWYRYMMSRGRRNHTDVDEGVRENWRKAVSGLNENHVDLVAEVDGRVRGFVDMEKKSHNYSHKAEIGFILVMENYRRLNIACTLLTSVAAELMQVGIELITLRTDSDNLAGQSLYHKCGFVEVGRIPKERKFRTSGEYVDSVIMAKPLQSKNDPSKSENEKGSVA